MRSRASRGPNGGTGALNQDGSRARHAWRKATRRGQSGQFRPGAEAATAVSVLEFVVVRGVGGRALRRGAALEELRGVAGMARLTRPALGPFRGVAADLGLQFDDVHEDVGFGGGRGGDPWGRGG